MPKSVWAGFVLLLATATLVAKSRLDEIRYRERVLNTIIRLRGAPIRRFSPNKLKKNQLAMKVEYSKLNLAQADVEKYKHLSRNNVLRIDYVTHRCRNDVMAANQAVDRQRVETLYQFNAKLFRNKKIKWGRIVQTACAFDYQALKWFHGFVLTMEESPDGTRNFLKERLDNAEKIEYQEGDITAQVQKQNSKSSPRPKTGFRPGRVSRVKFSRQWLKKTSNGYEITFPSRSLIPVPVICSGQLHISGGFNSHEYYSFKPFTGHNVWSVRLSDNGPSAAACESGVLVFNTESCTIFALSAKNGKHIWSYWLGDPLLSSPSISAGVAYAVYPSALYGSQVKGTVPTHVLAAFNLRSGKFIWQRWIDSDVIQAPVAGGGSLYVGSLSGALYQFAPKTGKIIKAYRHRLSSAPVTDGKSLSFSKRTDAKGDNQLTEKVASDDKELLTGAGNKMAAYLDRRIQNKSAFAKEAQKLDSRNGFHSGPPTVAHAEASYIHLGLKRVAAIQNYGGSRPVRYKDKVIVTRGDEVTSFDYDDGDKNWTVKLEGDLQKSGGALGSSPSVAGQFAFVSTLKGKILQINLETGKVEKTYSVNSPMRLQPLLHGGFIFAVTTNGKLVAINTKDKTITGWTAWGKSSRRNTLAN